MEKFCSKCGNEIENNKSFCSNCGNQLKTDVQNSQRKKIGYGKCLGFTILGVLCAFFLGWLISFASALVGAKMNMSLIMIGVPILGIVFSPIIALIVYLIKNK